MFRQLLLAAFAAVMALAVQPASSAAQKALVYCPAGADAGGCARVVSAISSKFTAVDKAYDGTAGTLDLRKTDLDHYAVIVVPSLADAGDRRPYELLRGEAARMKLAVTGRVAVFSGAPDQGAANREAKDAVIANLVNWAAEGHTRPVGLVGLVAFQDLSDDAAARYDWVAAASPVDVSADVELKSFRSVKTQAALRSSFFTKGDAELAYPNMASYGLHIGKNAAARTISAAVGGDAGQTVLVTYGEPGSTGPQLLASVAGGDTAWVNTDKQDYMPGETVTFTGGNWAPGDTVKITLHEDPHWADPDRVVTAVADANGKFTNRTFIVDQHDFGVTFTATAVATPSGKTALHTFTDGNPNNIGFIAASATVTQGSTATYTVNVTMGGNTDLCTVTFSTTGLSGVVVTFVGGATVTTSSSISKQFTVATTSSTPTGTQSFTVTAARGNDCQGNGNLSALGSLVVNAPASVSTTTSVANATATFADASVTLSATVTPASGPAVGSGSVAFTVKQGATTIGSSVTDNTVVGGVASVTYLLPAGTAAGSYTVEATYTAGAGFSGSTGTGTLAIGKATSTTTVTCAAGPFTYTGSPLTPCSATVTGVGGLNQSITPTYSNNTNVGTATATATFAENTNYLSSTESKTFAIGKAATTTTVSCGAGPFAYSGAAQTPCTATVTGPSLSEAVAVTYTNNTNAGTATATATYAESANHLGSTDSKTFTIDKAATTTTVTCTTGPFVFDLTFKTPCTATVTGPGAPALSETLTVTYADNKYAGTATASASYAATANYLGSTDTETFTIQKAPTTINLTCGAGPFAYTGAAQTPCSATVTSFPSGITATVNPTYANNTNAGTASATASFAESDNYLASTNTKTFTIAKATSSVALSCPTVAETYTGSPLTPCTAVVNGAGTVTGTATLVYSSNENVGTASVTATYVGDDNHTGSSASGGFAIKKAASTTTVVCAGGPFTYTGSPLTPCTASATGAGIASPVTVTPVNHSNNVNAGTAGATATWGGDANHEGSTGNATFTIDKASSTTVVSCTAGTYTYNGSAHTPCSVSVTGAGLSLTPTPTYANNVNAGTATASYTFAGDDNHTGSSDSKTFTIDKKALTITADDKTKIYDNAPFSPFTSSYNGLVAVDETGGQPNAGVLSAPVSYGGAAATAVNAGTYAIEPSGATAANYTITFANGTLKIDKAASTTTVTCTGGPFVYNGAAQTPCTATATGAGGLSVAVTPVAHSNNTNAGTASASATFGGDANHHGSSGNTTFTIEKAATVTALTCSAGPFTYDGTAKTPCTAKVTGPVLDQSLTPTYSNNINAGTATANASYAETANYLASSDSKTFTIDKATSSVVVTCPTAASSPIYTGDPITPCSAVVNGAGTVTGTASLVYSDNTNAGTAATVVATYAGDVNHTGSTGNGSFTINKADPTVTVNGYTGTYDGQPHGASGNAKGVKNEALAGLVLGASFTDVPGGTANWSFPGNGNYNAKSGTAAIVLSKATQTITWANPASIAYPTALGATQLNATVAGVTPGSAPGALSYTPAAGTILLAQALPHTLTVNAAETENYLANTKQVQITVTNGAPVVTSLVVDPATAVFAKGSTAAKMTVAFTDPGQPNDGYTASLALTGVTNASVTSTAVQYNAAAGTGTFLLDLSTVPVGVYLATVTVTDRFGGSGSKNYEQYVVVYDPSGSFVTGGGWINSPAGALVASPTATGKANFGFVSKYQKGANLPSGNTEFQFHAGDLNFKSTSYDWLVVAGSRAQFKGTGTINGAGSYSFILTATDGQVGGGGGVDKFRIKIMNGTTVVYDNMLGASDDADLNNTTGMQNTALGGGSIQIQNK